MFASIIPTTGIDLVTILLCTAVSLVLGILCAFTHLYRNHCTKGFAVTLILLPAVVQMVIMLVNGNLGTGVAVAGAFSLIRFRSVPGKARDICAVFLAMAVGLATGTGYLAAAAIFAVILCAATLVFYTIPFAEKNSGDRRLKIVIPEDLDYENVFDDLLRKYTKKYTLTSVKTTNLGSMFELHYNIRIQGDTVKKEFLDAIRCRNGNLTVSCAIAEDDREEL